VTSRRGLNAMSLMLRDLTAFSLQSTNNRFRDSDGQCQCADGSEVGQPDVVFVDSPSQSGSFDATVCGTDDANG
jgi:hypothetical protein